MKNKGSNRTQSSIFLALLQLLSEKELVAITVKELCVRADVNKSTFYLHFSDIYDCHRKWLLYNVNAVLAFHSETTFDYYTLLQSPGLYMEQLLDYIEENLYYFKKLYNSPFYGQQILAFKKLLAEFVTNFYHLSPTSPETCDAYYMNIFFLCGVVDTIFSTLNSYDRAILRSVLARCFDSNHSFLTATILTDKNQGISQLNS